MCFLMAHAIKEPCSVRNPLNQSLRTIVAPLWNMPITICAAVASPSAASRHSNMELTDAPFTISPGTTPATCAPQPGSTLATGAPSDTDGPSLDVDPLASVNQLAPCSPLVPTFRCAGPMPNWIYLVCALWFTLCAFAPHAVYVAYLLHDKLIYAIYALSLTWPLLRMFCMTMRSYVWCNDSLPSFFDASHHCKPRRAVGQPCAGLGLRL